MSSLQLRIMFWPSSRQTSLRNISQLISLHKHGINGGFPSMGVPQTIIHLQIGIFHYKPTILGDHGITINGSPQIVFPSDVSAPAPGSRLGQASRPSWRRLNDGESQAPHYRSEMLTPWDLTQRKYWWDVWYGLLGMTLQCQWNENWKFIMVHSGESLRMVDS